MNAEAFLPGEVKSYVETDIFLFSPDSQIGVLAGTLTITNYRLHFVGESTEIDVPLGFIARVDKHGGVSSRKEHAYRIEVVLKGMRNLQFALNPENHGRRTMYTRLKTYAFPLNNKRKVFAFSNLEKFDNNNGWQVFDPVAEYRRILGPDNPDWVISTELNQNYTFCDTYPGVLVIPNEIHVSRGVLKSVAAFRSRSRLPVLTWRHPSGAILTRSSQPLTGVKNKRSSDDEFYLSVIIKTNPKTSRLAIMDARPRANAFANRTRNGGYETEDAYKMADLLFLNIHSIHVMRDSWNKLKEMLISGTSVAKLNEGCSWLKHIRRILLGVWHVVDRLEREVSVLVHCSDGWDRTAQLTSISMLLMDPYYRTIIGFEVLVEKEWLSYGHKFQTRIGHGDHHANDSDRSPVFLQFIDCVYQLTTQFPTAFEFNERFLIQIADHLYSCRFGTFLCNTERERKQEKLSEKTVSLWSYLNSSLEDYRNTSYERQDSALKIVVGKNVKLWEGLFCRWMPKTNKIADSIRFVSETGEINSQFYDVSSSPL